MNESDHRLSLARNIVRHSSLFDAKWYLAQHPDVAASGRDPADHYCFVGWKLGFNPGPSFDGNAYLAANPDVKKAERNPLVHYIQFGIKEKRPLKPVPKLTPKPTPKPTSPAAPKAATPAKKPAADPLQRDIAVVSKSELFDGAWYLKHYPDVAKAKMDPVRHYCMSGWREGRRPGPNFDGNAYLTANPDVKNTERNPLVHYVQFGIKEKRPLKPVPKPTPKPVVKAASKAAPANTMAEKAVAQPMQKSAAVKRSSWFGRLFAYRPKISVIVASYNYEQYIGETLDGILNQTYGNYEVIVIDDGSKDRSVDVIKKYVAKSSKIKFFQHEGGKNKGLPATVKLGVEKSTGDYIAFCESDDIWESTNLERKVDLIRQSRCKAKIIINDITTFGDQERCQHLNEIINDRMKRMDKFANFITPEEFRDKNYICTFSCVMVERKLLGACDFLSTPRPSNLDWWLWRQLCYVTPIHVVREKLTRWRCHQSYMVRESVRDIAQTFDFREKLDAVLYDAHPEIENEISRRVKEERSVVLLDGVFYRGEKKCGKQPVFSVIMPTYNRAHCICEAIDSLLGQTYQKFELVIVDDGSTDDTGAMLKRKYANEIASARIVYKRVQNGGVCKARNVGLKKAKNPWIAYLDSDNQLHARFLEVFARAIVLHPEYAAFYAQQIYQKRKIIAGRAFNLKSLLYENFIDLGVYVHSKRLVRQLGGFDDKMTRLVDWELIVRYSKKFKPFFIKRILMFYNDEDDAGRITNSVSLYKNLAYFRKKHCSFPKVTTMVTTYNHAPFIKMALDNAICQKGPFIHEVLLSDDCSTDGTRDIVREYAAKYEGLVKDVSSPRNLGISANMKKCFETATGKYIAVLEGDDYWVNPFKLKKQMEFLEANPDCSMVFSRPKINKNGVVRLLPRHDNLPSKLTGRDFFNAETISLLVNFSCCMFRRDLLQNMPEIIYKNRLSEIALAFYLLKFGKIGFINEGLSTYRIHGSGTFSGATYVQKRQQERFCREVAMQVCEDEYKPDFAKAIAKIDEEIARHA